jgi:hypothetical protein
MRRASVMFLLSACLLSSCLAFVSPPSLLLRRSVIQHVHQGSGSDVYPDIKSLILNDSIPIEARQALLDLTIEVSAAAQNLSDVKEAAAQNLSAVKEALSSVKEDLWNEQGRGQETTRLLEAAMTRDATMNPRSVIEYVELFVMPQGAPYFKTKDRRKKWESFLLDDTTSGPAVMKCLKEQVPSWGSASKAADQLSSIYSYTSENVHVTSYEIAENPNGIPIRITEGPSLLLQGGKAMLCIGKVLGLAIELKKKG